VIGPEGGEDQGAERGGSEAGDVPEGALGEQRIEELTACACERETKRADAIAQGVVVGERG
jgi:hypothetical protein